MMVYPDGFTGALMAVESFKDGRAVIHGPGGCRSYHSYAASRCYTKSNPEDCEKYSVPYFFGQSRVPCTYMDEDDYIHGSGEKIEESLPILCSRDDMFNVFIKSPGAALIGDNITDAIERAGYSDKALAVEESLISRPFSSGYDHTVRTVLQWINPKKRKTRPGTVNILGLPISGKDWESALEDLKQMLELIGLEIISSPGAGCSREDIAESVAAEYNVIVSNEYCARTADFYLKNYGIPAIRSDMGAPVGFDATEKWVELTASKTGKDAGPIKELIRHLKSRVFRQIRGTLFTNKIKGNDFVAMSDASVLLPLTEWLYGYLGMIPLSVTPNPGEDDETAAHIRRFLKIIGAEDAWRSNPAYKKTDFVFADGHTAELSEMYDLCRKGVDIGYPSLSRIGFLPRPVYGLYGAMYLLDEIFSKE